MNGYTYGEKVPEYPCPYCGTLCTAEYVDVGVGMVQCGPHHCECGASEIGPNDEPRELTEEERKHGWYGPGSEPGSSANVINGKIVTSYEADAAYRNEFECNPRYHEPGVVDDFWKDLRKKNE